MKMLLALAAFSSLGIAQARPVIIEERAVIASPDPETFIFGTVGLDGDDAIIIGRKSVPDPDLGDNPDTLSQALQYRKAGDTWAFVGVLAEAIQDNEADAPNRYSIEMRDGIAAISMINLRVFERQGGSYVESPVEHGFNAPTEYVDLDGGTILLGDRCWGGSIVQKDPDGTWRTKAGVFADGCGDGDGENGGAVAIAGTSAAVPSPYNDQDLPAPALAMFRNFGNHDWRQTQRIVADAGHDFGNVAMTADVLYVQDSPRWGTARYYRSPADQLWRPSGIYLRADGDHVLIDNFRNSSRDRVALGGDFVLRNTWDHDRQASVVQMFQYRAQGVQEHVATLVASNGSDLGGHIAVSGRRVLISGGGGAHYFELPAAPNAPALLQDDFEGSPNIHWGVMPGGQFAIAPSGNTQVFRLSSTAGEAGTEVFEANWTSQSIQADVKPTALDGADRWVGLYTRRTSPSSYYYVTLRSSGILQLKRMYQGRFGTLDSASVPFTLNRSYRLRLESVGSRHRVYVDGTLVLDAFDADIQSGRAGLISYKMAADFDNVVVSPAHEATLWERRDARVCNLLCTDPSWHSSEGQWLWQEETGNEYFAQTDLAATARVTAGALTRNIDQIVATRARLRAFGTAADPWFGVIARYRDANNYVYLSLRRSNTLTLRKLVNGQIQELGGAALGITPGSWYRLRLDAVGDRLRAFVNGRLVLEAVDPTPAAGQVGLVTHRTQADFDDFLAVRP
jgi:hypothetical protein